MTKQWCTTLEPYIGTCAKDTCGIAQNKIIPMGNSRYCSARFWVLFLRFGKTTNGTALCYFMKYYTIWDHVQIFLLFRSCRFAFASICLKECCDVEWLSTCLEQEQAHKNTQCLNFQEGEHRGGHATSRFLGFRGVSQDVSYVCLTFIELW